MTSLDPAPSGVGHDVVDPARPDDGEAVRGSEPARPARLWVHLGLLLLALAAVLAVAEPSTSTWDEGSYGSQADALRDGSWYAPYRFADIDPSGRWFPIIYGERSADGWTTYTKHPLVPSLQSAFGRPLGRTGYLVPSILGVVGAAAAAWAIARRVRPGTEVLAFWITASGPLVFHVSIIWAHAMAAGFGGLAVLGAVMVRQRRSSWMGHLALASGVVGVSLVRSEGLLFSVCLLAAVGLDALLRPGVDDAGLRSSSIVGRAVTGVVSTVPAFVALVIAWFLEQRWVASIVGTAGSSLEIRSTEVHYSFLDGRLHGLWRSTLAGSDVAAWAPFLPLLLLVPLALVAARRRIGRPDIIAVALGGYALAMALLQFWQPSVLVGGLVPAWPLVPIGLVACGAGLWRHQRLLAITVALTAGAIWATEYPDGGVFQWGGRFFMVLAVPLAVLAADGIGRLLSEASAAQGVPARKTAVFGAVVALAVVSAIAPVVGLRTTRDQLRQTLGPVETTAGPVAITTSDEMGRLMWRSDVDLLHVDSKDLRVALRRLRERGLTAVSLVATAKAAHRSASAFGGVVSRTPVPNTSLYVWHLEVPGPS